MLYYHCKILLDSGEYTARIIAAEDYIALLDKVDELNGTLLRVMKIPQRFFRMSTQDSIFFFTYLREFLKADIPIVDAIDTVVDETRKVNIKAIASKLKHDISEGSLLSHAMHNQRSVFSDTTISLIAVSEKINALSDACDHIVDYLSFNMALMRKVRSAIMYPTMMFLIVFGMVVFYSKFVIPKLQAVFVEFGHDGSSSMPIQTELLVSFSQLIANNWLTVLISLILSFVVTRLLYVISHDFRCRFDAILLKIPLVSSIVIKSQFARFSLFTANMYDRGYNFLDSIKEATVVVTNHKICSDLENVISIIQSGDTVYRAMRKIPYIPRFVHRMFRIAEGTSNVQRPLHSVYEFYSQEVQNYLERVIRVIKPASIIVLGLLMFWIISATLLPFYTKLPELIQNTGA